LHSGDNVDTSCLNTNHSSSSGKSTYLAVTIRAAAGGVVVGLLAGAAGLFVFRRSRTSKRHQPRENLTHDNQLSSNSIQSPPPSIPTPANNTSGGSREYVVEPFTMLSSSSDPSVPHLPGNTAPSAVTLQSDAAAASGNNPAEQSSRRTNVYVVHHDGGRAPVTVYTEEGAEVVELPPRYPESSTAAPAQLESDEPRQTNRRNPGSSRKVRGPRPP